MNTIQQTDGVSPGNKIQFVKYAAINFAFYITISLSGYVTIFLQTIGFGVGQVGAVTALNSGVSIFATPFLGMLSDKIRSAKKVIIVSLMAGALLFALIPAAGKAGISGPSLLFILIPAAMFFKTPVMSLVDNWMLKNCAADKLNFGALRAFGALSYSLAGFALGYILPLTGVAFTFYINVIFTAPVIVMIVVFKSGADAAEADKKRLTLKEMRFGRLFKNYYLVTYIIFTVFQRIPFQCSMTFLPFLIEDIGGDIAQMGIIMGLRALVEIPMMLLLKPLRKKMPLYALIIIASGFFTLECVMYYFTDSFAMAAAVSIFHGLGNGLILTAGSSYVFSLAHDDLKATAQTALGSMTSIAGILGGLLGGALITVLGIRRFYLLIGAMILLAIFLFAASLIIGEKIFKIKRPGLSLN